MSNSSATRNNSNLPCPAEDLIVHRPPMLLIKELTARTLQNATALASTADAGACITSDHDLLPEYYIEIMAQTVAAAFGYDAKMKGIPPNEGYIVGINNFSFTDVPIIGDTLEINVGHEDDLGPVKVLSAEVTVDKRKIASAELKVWEQ